MATVRGSSCLQKKMTESRPVLRLMSRTDLYQHFQVQWSVIENYTLFPKKTQKFLAINIPSYSP